MSTLRFVALVDHPLSGQQYARNAVPDMIVGRRLCYVPKLILIFVLLGHIGFRAQPNSVANFAGAGASGLVGNLY